MAKEVQQEMFRGEQTFKMSERDTQTLTIRPVPIQSSHERFIFIHTFWLGLVKSLLNLKIT